MCAGARFRGGGGGMRRQAARGGGGEGAGAPGGRLGRVSGAHRSPVGPQAPARSASPLQAEAGSSLPLPRGRKALRSPPPGPRRAGQLGRRPGAWLRVQTRCYWCAGGARRKLREEHSLNSDLRDASRDG